MKSLACSGKVTWWSSLYHNRGDGKKACQLCHKAASKGSTHPWLTSWLSKLSQRAHVDFAGSREDYSFLHLTLIRSGVRCTNVQHYGCKNNWTILFAVFGLPHQIVSDNQWSTICEWVTLEVKWSETCIVIHIYHPEYNGEAESMKANKYDGLSESHKPQNFLLFDICTLQLRWLLVNFFGVVRCVPDWISFNPTSMAMWCIVKFRYPPPTLFPLKFYNIVPPVSWFTVVYLWLNDVSELLQKAQLHVTVKLRCHFTTMQPHWNTNQFIEQPPQSSWSQLPHTTSPAAATSAFQLVM